jgi:hypothetical protein
MRSILIGKFEFPPENILVLKDAQATHAGIISAIQRHLIADAQKDEIIVFHYSGHGSQMKDVTGKMISGLDETIVPYDSRDPAGKVFDISGAEVHGLLLQIAAKTKNITFILDSCHSGTLVRGDGGARVRGIGTDDRPLPPRLPEYAVQTRGLGQIAGDQPLQYAFLAATTSRENAFEHFAEGKEHGALTYFLVRQLRSAGSGVTYRDIMDNVAGNVAANYVQHPQLAGAEADQFVFGDASSLAKAYVIASPIDASRISLGGGQTQGVTVGSVYNVYPPGSKKFASPERPVATVRVSTVEPFTSEAKLVSGGRIPAFSRAIETEHRYGSLKLRIYFDRPENSPALQAIRTALASLPFAEVAPEPSTCHMQLRETGGRVLTLAADATTLSPPIATSDSRMVDRAIGQIRGWAKWFGALSIRNTAPELQVQFSVKGNVTRDPMLRVGKPDAGVWEGENIEATVKNTSNRDLYVTILDLSSDGSISIAYPADAGNAEVLKPGLSVSKLFRTFIPPGRSTVTDILKVFCASRPIDFRPLVQSGIREAAGRSDPLDELLTDAFAQRQVTPVDNRPLPLGDWTTALRVLVVKKKK